MTQEASSAEISQDFPCGFGLRSELSLRALRYAAAHGYPYERTDGAVPGIVFGRNEAGDGHGNFHPAVYARIVTEPRWARRLAKVHTGWRRARVRANWEWKELDCAHSSDALLMNVFCHPGVTGSARVRGLLGLEPAAEMEFGYRPRTPLRNGRCDTTEVDLRVGNLLIEAKLTESDFQQARPELLARYRDLAEVFELDELPLRNERQRGYQLVRGTLAAYAGAGSFCVLCDARRRDLCEEWYRVMRAVRIPDLRWRLKLLTWQELAAVLPPDLQMFLAEKYGIAAA